MPEVTINYFAVLVSAIAVIVVSFVWYGPLFGKAWMRMVGFDKATPEEMAQGKKKMPMNAFIQFVAALVMAWVMAHGIIFANAFMGTSGAWGGIMVGLMAWLGYVMPVSIGMVLWEGRSWKYWCIVGGNWLVNMAIIGTILGMWA